MMNPQRAHHRRRETFLALFLTVAFGCLIALFFMMISNRLFFAILAVLSGMIFLGCLQYLIWGRPMRSNAGGTDGHVLPGTGPTDTRAG
jgi:hypothetical protein